MNNLIFSFTLICLFSGNTIVAAESPGESGKAAVREEIKAIIEEGHYPGVSILLIHKGKVLMREAHGVVDLETKEPFTVDQLCWLASTGKMFTATLMAALVDDGVLDFDDPIAKTFPEFAGIRLRDGGGQPERPILLRHALSHTSGVPGNRWMEDNGLTQDDPAYAKFFYPENPRDFIDGCLKVGLAVEPGTRMLYGRPIDLSACVVEKLTGKPFTRMMEEKVFVPLGLKHTTIRPTSADLEKLAPLYQSEKTGVFEPDGFALEVAERQNKRLSTAGGGVYSTLDDLGILMQLHLNYGRHDGMQLIRPETLAELYQPQPGTNGRYGLAFQIMKSDVNGESTLYNHPGYSGPVAWFDFERQLAGVLLMQSNTVGRGSHHQRIIDRIHEMIPAETIKPVVLLNEDFQSNLSDDWFWGLGTWSAKDGILRGFESGERRHGPVKLRRFPLKDGMVECEFRIEGGATFASVPFNGSHERGHLLNVVMSRSQFRIIAHIRKGESVDLVRVPITLQDQEWHPVRIALKGENITVEFNGGTYSGRHPAIAEQKENFGFGGDSGGPEGEKVGALEFRNLKITTR